MMNMKIELWINGLPEYTYKIKVKAGWTYRVDLPLNYFRVGTKQADILFALVGSGEPKKGGEKP